MGNFPGGRWSGNQQVWWTGGQPGATLRIPMRVKEAGKYQLVGAFTKARDYGIVKIAVGDQTLIDGLDLFDPASVVTTGPLALGSAQLDAGTHWVTLEIVGAHPQAIKSHMVGIDYLSLQPSP
jgi:hypothetical protein